MKKINFYFKIIFFLVLSLPSVASEAENALNDAVTNILRQNWPYEAFLAIPRISEMRPTLAIEISKDDSNLQTSTCIELFYLELKKKFEPKALLEREALHKLLCKAMRRAITKTEPFLIAKKFPNSLNIALRFDFFNGLIKVVEMPYPPLAPIEKLENVFLDEGDVLIFGNIDLPEEIELEISQSPL